MMFIVQGQDVWSPSGGGTSAGASSAIVWVLDSDSDPCLESLWSSLSAETGLMPHISGSEPWHASPDLRVSSRQILRQCHHFSRHQRAWWWYKGTIYWSWILLNFIFLLMHPKYVRTDGRRLLSPPKIFSWILKFCWRSNIWTLGLELQSSDHTWAGSGHRIHQCHLIIKHLGLSHLDKAGCAKKISTYSSHACDINL